MSTGDPSPPRPWAMLTIGVALASSALTIVGVLGVQRVQRRRLRHDLEDDVKNAVRSRGDEEDKINKDGKEYTTDKTVKRRERSRMDSERSETSMPRYLAALAAAQQSSSTPSSATSRNAGTVGVTPPERPTMANAVHTDANISYSRPSTPSGNAPRKSGRKAAEYDESLIREQLSRNYSFLGEESMAALRNSFVIVVGAGGVGSWCALMLLRSGVGTSTIDRLRSGNLNRHACATLADVGRPKVQVCKERFEEIAPWCDVDARVEIFRGSEAARLLAPALADPGRRLEQTSPAYVVDCIDNLDTKVDLLAYCYHHKIPCFSSMGAGAKSDPSQIQVADLNTTAEDPLARRVRRGLRAKGVWGGGSDTRLLPLDEEEFQKGSVDELAALEDFRVRILPVLGPLPAMFGLAAATYVICTISGRTLEPLPFKGRRKTAERMFMELEQAERRYPSPGSKLSASDMAIGPRRIPWTVDDVAYVFEEVYRCRSVVPPHETLAIGKLLRWDSTLPLSYSNVALFSRGDGLKHEEQVLKQGRSPVELWGEEAQRMFKRRMAEERRMNILR
ncbi:hypothetical protein IEQ34_025135 [Dendrobium chrysotoxum]|uniref:THIF-type NAD/FAD binding fold domain-containing protein n=1 Tax=Dendrobium chrysotoxum TaxID=161865 RepID=A0AAV7FQQ3_DENCH|nr:hypothetical protein IEQ34_025135 [Dendrobium chrysotoxum]